MIVYREFSSLLTDLDVSAKTLYGLSNRLHRHYRPVSLPKGNGEFRHLWVPDAPLKCVQRRILDTLLPLEAVSPYATAYRPGGSTRRNALPHVGQPVLLKLDIRHFFDHLSYALVKEKAFPESRYSEQNRGLLTRLCVYRNALPQGASTSPALSNIILREFDDSVGAWCAARRIAYTRYCDDMTFSGDFDPLPVIRFVRSALQKLGLSLNKKKTVVARRGQKQAVTGIVVNEALHISAEYKRRLRQEMYYCMKFGAAAHMAATGREGSVDAYLLSLLGRVNYVLSVEPQNESMLAFRRWLTARRDAQP